MLLRYYTRELASWVYLTPVVASITGILLIFESPELAAYYILSMSITTLCVIYLDMREKQIIMTSLFPISRKTFFIVDLLFICRYAAYYTLFTLFATMFISTLLKNQLTFPSVKQLLLSVGICLFIIASIFGIRRIKFGVFINLQIVIVPLLFIQLLPFITELTIQQCVLFLFGSFVLFIIAASFTYFREDRRDIL